MTQMTLKSTFWTMMVVFGLIAFGCSADSGKLLKEVSGVWTRDQGTGTVAINLTGKDKSLVIDGQSYAATVQSVEMGNYVVALKVQNGSGQPEIWSVREAWDDNGDNFKLVFRHDGQKEILPKKTSS
jgi:hypothetical protein